MVEIRQIPEKFAEKREEIKAEVSKGIQSLPEFVLDLPSKGMFYADKNSKVTVSALSVKQIREIHAASMLQGRYDQEAQLISALSSSIRSKSIYDLTLGDFDFIRHWIRLNTYKKSPLRLTWVNDVDGIRKEVTSVVTSTDLSIIEVEDHFVANRKLAFPTVNDYLDMLKMTDESEKYVASWACYLIGESLQDKINTLNSMNAADIIPDIKEYQQKSAHGVNEFVNLVDPDFPDMTPVRVKLGLEAVDFFP